MLDSAQVARNATDLYLENREIMDEGGKVAWDSRYEPGEISAIQHAMNILIDRPRAFHAEYQNEPLVEETLGSGQLTVEGIGGKSNGMARGVVDLRSTHVTCFIDIQETLLYYLVAAWRDDFTGQIIDYGTFPDQHVAYFTLADARITLASAVHAAGLEGRLYAGLEYLCGTILGREWQREDGTMLKVERCLIDANWPPSTQTVYDFCRRSPHAAILVPSHGKYIGASNMPMRDYTTIPGDRVGLNWRITIGRNPRGVRHVLLDVNYWKSFIQRGLETAIGDVTCISLFGNDSDSHRLLAEHLCAEYRIRTEGRGRKLDEWKIKPERFDNHWFDCLVGAAVAASMQGVAVAESERGKVERAPRKRVSFAEQYRNKQQERQLGL